eukprot:3761988-Rhodomonas_salina.1
MGLVAEVDDAPDVGGEPEGGELVLLVLADQDGVRHRQQPHHRRRLLPQHTSVTIVVVCSPSTP